MEVGSSGSLRKSTIGMSVGMDSYQGASGVPSEEAGEVDALAAEEEAVPAEASLEDLYLYYFQEERR